MLEALLIGRTREERRLRYGEGATGYTWRRQKIKILSLLHEYLRRRVGIRVLDFFVMSEGTGDICSSCGHIRGLNRNGIVFVLRDVRVSHNIGRGFC